jgi:predicted alpha/beta-fold hydrolase
MDRNRMLFRRSEAEFRSPSVGVGLPNVSGSLRHGGGAACAILFGSVTFAPLVRHRHLQTVWAPLFRGSIALPVNTEAWATADGDAFDVDLLPVRAGAPGIVVLHGLEGSSRASYVRGTLAEANARGWNGAALNFRSCGPTPHKGPRTYHSGFTEDLEAAVARLSAVWKGSPIVAAGFSLGGNVLLKWLGERGDGAPVVAAVAVSVPYDLAACARSLDGGGMWAWIYRTRFLRTLKRKALADARRHPSFLDPVAIRAASSFSEFDGAVTARLHGFTGAEDYWARSSSAGFLGRIRRPTLLLSAADDPFIPVTAIPKEVIAGNASLTLRLEPHGGHVGFVGGSLMRPVYAAEKIAIEFLERNLVPRI